MERVHRFRMTQTVNKHLKNSTPENPLFESKKHRITVACDLDDIKFIDAVYKNNGDPYKTKCMITHQLKGDLIIDHSPDEITDLVKNKYKTSYIRVKGFGK